MLAGMLINMLAVQLHACNMPGCHIGLSDLIVMTARAYCSLPPVAPANLIRLNEIMSGSRHNKGKAERTEGRGERGDRRELHLCIVCSYLLSQWVNKSIKL